MEYLIKDLTPLPMQIDFMGKPNLKKIGEMIWKNWMKVEILTLNQLIDDDEFFTCCVRMEISVQPMAVFTVTFVNIAYTSHISASETNDDVPHHLTAPVVLVVLVFDQSQVTPGLMSPEANIPLVQLNQVLKNQSRSSGPLQVYLTGLQGEYTNSQMLSLYIFRKTMHYAN